MVDIDVIGLGALNTDHIYLTSRTLDDDEAVVAEAGSFPGGALYPKGAEGAGPDTGQNLSPFPERG